MEKLTTEEKNELLQSLRAQNTFNMHFSNFTLRFVWIPLAILIDAFKLFFSKVLGLEFLVNLSGQKNSLFKITLPTFHVYYNISNLDNDDDTSLFDTSENSRVGFTRAENVYYANYVTMPLFFWNYICRNLGKVFGLVLGATTLLPVIPFLFLFATIKQAKIAKELENPENSEIFNKFCWREEFSKTLFSAAELPTKYSASFNEETKSRQFKNITDPKDKQYSLVFFAADPLSVGNEQSRKEKLPIQTEERPQTRSYIL